MIPEKYSKISGYVKNEQTLYIRMYLAKHTQTRLIKTQVKDNISMVPKMEGGERWSKLIEIWK